MDFRAETKPPPAVSAIVPTFEEAAGIASCLERLRAAGLEEIIVVDGGSRDATVEIARSLADVVREVPGGLFAQLLEGARIARGGVLLFHYADGRFPLDGLARVRSALADPRVVGGAFRLGFDSPRRVYRLIALGARVRNRLGLGPFGDQSIFVRRPAYDAAGGHDPRELLADHVLVRRLRRSGRFELLSAEVATSVRRWEKRGVARTMVDHWRVSVLWLLGIGRRRGGARLRETIERLRRSR